MAATTFFANMVKLYLLNTWTSLGTVTLTKDSASFTGGTTGDYVWLARDGVGCAARVLNGTTLAYTYKGAGGSATGYKCTPEMLAVLRGMEFNVAWETAELYGTESVFRVDQAKYQVKIETKIKYSKWNADVAVEWTTMDYGLLRPESATGTDGTIRDTNAIFTNGVVYRIIGTNNLGLEFVCGPTYWQGLPMPFPENDFIVRDMTGYASNATFNQY